MGCPTGWALSRVELSATPWTVAHQVLLSMEFSRQEYWSGLPLPLPTPGDLHDPGIEPTSLVSPVSSRGFFTTSTTWEIPITYIFWFEFIISIVKMKSQYSLLRVVFLMVNLSY